MSATLSEQDARLQAASDALLRGQDCSEVLGSVLQGVQELGFDRVGLYLLSEDGEFISGAAHVGMSEDFIRLRRPVAEDPHIQILREKRCAWIFKHDPDAESPQHDALERQDVDEWVCAPVMLGDRFVGKVTADNKYSRRPIDESQRRHISVYAALIAAMENAELAASDARKLRQLEQISRSIKEIVGRLGDVELQERLDRIAQHAAEILGAEVCSVFLTSHDEYLTIEASHGHREGEFNPGQRFAIRSEPGSGVTGYVAATRRIFNAHGATLREHIARRNKGAAHLESGECFSMLAIPLLRKDGLTERLVGLLKVENKKDHDGRASDDVFFSRADEWIFEIFAEAVVVAISSAALVDRLHKQRDDLEESQRRLGLLLNANNVVSRATDLRAGLGELARLLVTELKVTYCSFFLNDDLPGILRQFAVSRFDPVAAAVDSLSYASDQISVPEWPMLLNLLDNNDPTGIAVNAEIRGDDLKDWTTCLSLPDGLQRIQVLPLEAANGIVGILCLGESEAASPREESLPPVDLTAALASQTATLVERDRNHERAIRQKQLLDKLDSHLNHLRTVHELGPLRHEVVRLAADLVGFSSAALFKCWPTSNEIELCEVYGLPQAQVGSRSPYGQGVAGRAAKVGAIVTVPSPTTRDDLEAPFNTGDFQTVIALPLKAAGIVDGILVVAQGSGCHRFGYLAQHTLERYAARASIVLEDARLTSREARVLARLRILYYVSHYMHQSDDLYKVLHATLTAITADFGLRMNRAGLFLIDEARERFIGKVGIGHFSREVAEAEWAKHMREGGGDIGTYLEHLERGLIEPTPVGDRINGFELPYGPESGPLYEAVRDSMHRMLGEDELQSLPNDFLERLEPSCPLLLAPLVARGRVIGIIVADNAHTRAPITQEDREVLMAFANTTAITVDNIQLREQRERLQEKQRQFHRASNALDRSAGTDELLREIANETHGVMDAWWVGLMLVDGLGQVEAITTSGRASGFSTAPDKIATSRDEPQAIRASSLPTWTDGLQCDEFSAEVMKSGEAISVSDSSRRDSPVARELAKHEIAAAICVPFSLEGKPLGVMWVNYDAPRPFPPGEVDTLQLFVNQAAIAYDSARRVNEQVHLRKAAEVVAGADGLTGVLHQIAERACSVLRADSAVIWSYDRIRSEFIQDESIAFNIAPDLWAEFREVGPSPGGTAFQVLAEQWVGITDVEDRETYPQIGERTLDLLRKASVRSFQGIALSVGDELLGVLCVNYRRRQLFDDDMRETAENFASHTRLALNQARLRSREDAAIQLQLKTFDLIDEAKQAANKVAEVSDLRSEYDAMLDSLTKVTLDALQGDAVALYTYDQVTSQVNLPPKVADISESDLGWRSAQIQTTIVEGAMHSKAPLLDGVAAVIEKAREDDVSVPMVWTASQVGLPLRAGGQIVGAMFVQYRRPHEFTRESLRKFEIFAQLAAVAIRHAQQYDELARAKALAAARTVLAWIGMSTNHWRHIIEGDAVTIKNTITNLWNDLMKIDGLAEVPAKIQCKLKTMERLADNILARPMTPPLSSEEGISDIHINEQVTERVTQYEPSLARSGIGHELILMAPDDTLVRASPEWIRRAFDILMDNAVAELKSARRRNPMIRVETHCSAGRVEIRVADNGRGIPGEILAQLFHTQIRATRESHGLGIGLLMAQAIVETYGGTVFHEPNVSGGAIMVIDLPRADAPPSPMSLEG